VVFGADGAAFAGAFFAGEDADFDVEVLAVLFVPVLLAGVDCDLPPDLDFVTTFGVGPAAFGWGAGGEAWGGGGASFLAKGFSRDKMLPFSPLPVTSASTGATPTASANTASTVRAAGDSSNRAADLILCVGKMEKRI
jgi:hypothetical protein